MNCLKCHFPIVMEEPKYGLHAKCFSDWFGVSESITFTNLTRKSAESGGSLISKPVDGSFFQGKYKKYSAELEHISFILKMKGDDTPELPAVEYLCNQIGKLLRVPVADFYIISFEEELVFVTKNFISSQNIPVNLSHLYHYLKDGNQHNCERIIQVIIHQTKRPLDVDVFIKTVLFDSLIGNHDRHGRNLGFIVQSTDVTLSPIYDNVSYLSLEPTFMLAADHNPRGKIATSNTTDPTMRDYVNELSRLGYDDVINEFYSDIELDEICNLIEKSFCSEEMKKAILTLISKRYKELKDEIRIKVE